MADDAERGGNALLNSIAHPTIVNPLAAYRDAASVANSIWQTREWQARQAAGQASAGAIDETGTFVPATANRNLAAMGPGAALAAQETIKNNQALQGAQIEQGGAARKIISNELGPLMALPDDQLGAGITGAAARLRAARIPEAVIDQTLLNMPSDPAGQRQYLNQLRLQLAPPDQLQENLPGYGKTGTMTAPGGNLTGYTISPQGAVSQPPQQGAQQGLSPEAGAARVITGYDPKTGQPIYGPAESVAPPQMRPGSVGPGRLPPALRGPGAQPSAQPGAAGTDPSVVAAPDPRTGAQNEADQKAFLAEQSAIPTHQTAVQSLLNAQHALELTRTGGGTAGSHAIKSFLSAQGVSTAGMDESAENYDKFAKYAIDYARQQAAGAGTNLQLEAAEHSNANPAMLAGANRAVLQTNIGRERQKIAMNMEAPDQKTGGGYIGHTSKYASNTDPRGFAVDAYTPEELKKLTGGMTDTERKKFWKTVGIADRLGLLNPRQ